MSKISEKLAKLNLNNLTNVRLQLSKSQTVQHYTGDYPNAVYEKTGFINELARVITYPSIRNANSLIDNIRMNDFLLDYERGSNSFMEYVANVLSFNRFEYVDHSLDAWDHKRGQFTISSEFEVPIDLLLKAEQNGLVLGEDWSIYVLTDAGDLELKIND